MTTEPVLDRARRRTYKTLEGLAIVGDDTGDHDAPAVVLMHGGGQTRHSWSGAFKSLARAGYRVLNYDARGHGDSDWSAESAYSLDDRVRDLNAVLADLKSPFVLVGASLGGATALHAIAGGVAAQGLVMVDIVPEPEAEGIDNIRAFMESGIDGFASLEDVANAVAAYNPDRPRSEDPRGLMKNLRQRSDGRLYWHWDPGILGDSNIARSVLKHSAERLAEHTDVPVLVVRGLRSDVVSDAGVAAFKKLIPALQVCNVAGAGHMVAGDRNDVFNEAILDFLSRVFPTGVK